ncbi:hypothetical protein MUK42_07992, partial [Musa troglodytarum]
QKRKRDWGKNSRRLFLRYFLPFFPRFYDRIRICGLYPVDDRSVERVRILFSLSLSPDLGFVFTRLYWRVRFWRSLSLHAR